MLPFKNRIRKENDFKRVFEKGKLFRSELVIVKFLESEEKEEETRFGFVVSKKVSLKAVDRNRVKRILREQIRLQLGEIKKGFDIIIIAKKEILSRKSEEIGSAIDNFLKASFLK